MRFAVATALICLGTVSCAPRLSSVLQVPKLVVRSTEIKQLDMPGLGVEPQLVLVVHLRAYNPNPVGVKLLNLQGTFYLDDVATGQITVPALALLPSGSSDLTSEIHIPLTADQLPRLAGLALGDEVSYRLEGLSQIDAGALGQPTLGPYTLLQGTLKDMPLFRPPNIRLRPDLFRLEIPSWNQIQRWKSPFTVQLALEVQNPNVLGFTLDIPLELQMGGLTVAKSSVQGAVPARAAGVLLANFSLNPLDIPQQFLAGRFRFELLGSPQLRTPFGTNTQTFKLLTTGDTP